MTQDIIAIQNCVGYLNYLYIMGILKWFAVILILIGAYFIFKKMFEMI